MSEWDYAWNDTMSGALVGPGWLPIEEAPKDGTEVLVYERQPDGSAFIDIASNSYEVNLSSKDMWVSSGGNIPSCEPTHWMPLPPPPKDTTP